MADTIGNTKIGVILDFGPALASLQKLIGVMQQTAGVSNADTAALQKLEAQLADVAVQQSAVAGGTGKATEQMRQQSQAAKSVGDRMATLGLAINGVREVGRIFSSTLGGLNAEYNKLEASNRMLEGTAQITGTSLSFLKNIASKAKDEFKLSTTMANAFTVEINKLTTKAGDTQKTSEALKSLLNIAAAKGMDAAGALRALSQAVLEQDEGTDKLFNKNPSVIYEEWAKAAGVSAGKMTDLQKGQALLNAVLDDGKRARDKYKEYLESSAGQQEQLRIQLSETKAEFGKLVSQGIIPFLGPANRFIVFIQQAPAGVKMVGMAIVTLTGVMIALNMSGLLPLLASIPKVIAGIRTMGLVSSGALGPIGLLIGILTTLGIAFLTSSAHAKTADDRIKDLGKTTTDYYNRVASFNLQQLRAELATIDTEVQKINRVIDESRAKIELKNKNTGIRIPLIGEPKKEKADVSGINIREERKVIDEQKRLLDELAEKKGVVEGQISAIESAKRSQIEGTNDEIKSQIKLLEEALAKAKKVHSLGMDLRIRGPRKPGEGLQEWAKEYLDLRIDRQPLELIGEKQQVMSDEDVEKARKNFFKMTDDYVNTKNKIVELNGIMKNSFSQVFDYIAATLDGQEVRWDKFIKSLLINIAKMALMNALFPGGGAGVGALIQSAGAGGYNAVPFDGGMESFINTTSRRPTTMVNIQNNIPGSEFYYKVTRQSEISEGRRRI